MSAKSIIRLLLRATVAGTALLAFPACAIVNGDRVGDKSFASDYEWMVAIARPGSSRLCGGMVIAQRWVITAAHCTSRDRFILFGSANRMAAQKIEVIRAIRHPNFSATDFRYDIGLLELAEAVPAATLDRANRAQTEALLRPGANAIIAGWGKTATRNKPVSRLVTAAITLGELQVLPTQFVFTARSGPCSNDSGGPLVMISAVGTTVLVGIASRTGGNLCSKNGGLSIYSRVDIAAEFIATFVRQKNIGGTAPE